MEQEAAEAFAEAPADVQADDIESEEEVEEVADWSDVDADEDAPVVRFGDEGPVQYKIEEPESPRDVRIWRPGDELKEGEELEEDASAYVTLHAFECGWPCLSFDFFPAGFAQQTRTSFPYTFFLIAGTQAATRDENCIMLVRSAGVRRTLRDSDDEPETIVDLEHDVDDEGDPPEFCFRSLNHPGDINRLMLCPQLPRILATWAGGSGARAVHFWDTQETFRKLEDLGSGPAISIQPMFTMRHHTEEGFAMDWNPHATGRFLTGAGDGMVFLYEPKAGGWEVASRGFASHQGAVEAVGWKKSGEGAGEVFAVGGADKCIRLYDTRSGGSKAVHVISAAHEGDVNDVSWNPIDSDMLLSGGDDGACVVWDMRQPGTHVAKMDWHRDAVVNVNWHPTESSSFVATGMDDSVSVWDLSMEAADDARVALDGQGNEIPPELLFLHLGQKHITETKFHPSFRNLLVSTAFNGFRVFEPAISE